MGGRGSGADAIHRLNKALLGRYHIERELGEGGMATVYLADDLRHERKVALKVLRSEWVGAVGPERFLREIRITANLQHPHILPLHDSGEADGFLFYVMPYVKGESLRDRLDREGELPVDETIRVLRHVLDALAAAHRAGVIHRDIKPGNILLSDGYAMVGDFGVAKAVAEARRGSPATTVGVSLGTPAYMSPEQASADETVDARSDLYAVGVLAYEMLSGTPPFTGLSYAQMLAAKLTREPEPLLEKRPTVAPELAGVIMRCLERRPADRWQNATDLLAELAAVDTGGRPTGSRRGRSPISRSGVAGMWAAVAVVTLLIGAGVWGLWARAPEASAPQDASSETLSDAGETRAMRLIVLPFEPRGAEVRLPDLGIEFAEAIVRTVDQHTTIDIVPPSTLASSERSGASIFELGAGTRATYGLSGSYGIVQGEITVAVDVLNLVDSSMVRRIDAARVPRDSIAQAVESTAQVVAAAMVVLDGRGEVTVQHNSLPKTAEAARLLEDAADELGRGRFGAAADLALQAIELEPDWVGGYMLARPALFESGRSSEWQDLRPRAEALLPTMTQYERLSWDNLEGNHDNVRLAAATELFELVGPWRRNGYMLAFRGIQRNNMQAALRGLEAHFDGPDDPTWWPAWMLHAWAYHLDGQYENELARARDGRSRFPDNILLARDEARALAALGRTAEAQEAARQMEVLPAGPDSLWAAIHDVGLELRRHGHPEASRRALDRLVDWSAERTEGIRPYRIALGLHDAGRYEEALPVIRADIEAEGDRGDYARMQRLALLVLTLEALGRPDEARRVEQQFPGYTPMRYSYLPQWPAAIMASRGEASRAVDLLRRAFDESMRYYDWNNDFMHVRPEFEPIRDDAAFVALMRPKG